MAEYRRKAGKEINLRKENKKEPLTLSKEAYIWLEELQSICLYQDVGYMTFPRVSTGGKSYTFFIDDDKVKWYLSTADDPAEEVLKVLEYLFGAVIAQEVQARVRARLAQLASKAAKSS